MLKNHKLARAIADSSWIMLRQQIEYKDKLRDCTVIIADRFFPSSKKCFDCDAIDNNLTLADRQFICDFGNGRCRRSCIDVP